MFIADTLTDGDNMQNYELFMIEDAFGRKNPGSTEDPCCFMFHKVRGPYRSASALFCASCIATGRAWPLMRNNYMIIIVLLVCRLGDGGSHIGEYLYSQLLVLH